MKKVWMVAASGIAVLMLPASASCQTLVPYQSTQIIQSNACGGNQCVLSYPIVPSGKRLIVTSVSAQLPGNVTSILLQNGGPQYYVPAVGNSGYLAAQITLYYDPGAKPQVRVFLPPNTSLTSIVVTLVGNLVPS